MATQEVSLEVPLVGCPVGTQWTGIAPFTSVCDKVVL